MFKVIRWFVTLILVALVVGVIAAQFVTFNQFKQLAAQKVKEATGRNLEIAGDIKLSFYPVLGAKVEKISLSNMPGAQQPAMLSVDKVMVGVKLMPLLHKQVELEKIVLEKPIVFLEKNAAGQANWQFPQQPQPAAAPTTNAASAQPPVKLGGIEITDGLLSYSDAKSGKPVEVSKLNAFVSLTDLDSPLRVSASADVAGMPIKLSLATDSPNALQTEKGSATNIETVVYGITSKLSGTISATPSRVSIGNMVLNVQQMQAKGKVDVALGGAVPVVNATVDFGVINLDTLTQLAAVPAGSTSAGTAPTAHDIAAAKTTYIDPAVFKTVDGSLALSAAAIETKAWKISQPKFRANMGNGIVAAAAAGQFASGTQPPMNFAFTSPDLVALLKPEGGAFTLDAKAQDKNIAAQGKLALTPGLVALNDAAITYNGQPLNARVRLKEDAGNQALDAAIALTKNGQQWQITAKTPALQSLMQPEGAELAVTLQSGSQKANIDTHFSQADNVMKLNPLTLALNGGTGKGYITFSQKTPVPQVDVNMQFGTLDLNPLLSFAQSQGGHDTANNAASSGASASKDTPLRNVNAQVNLKAKQLKAKNVQISNVDLTATVKDGILELNMPDIGLYSGKANIKAHVDGRTPVMAWNLSTDGSGVNIGNLLVDALQNKTFSGIGQWKTSLTGSGTQTPALYNTLNGEGSFELQQGVIRGMDLFRLMSAARSGGLDALTKQSDETDQIHATGSFTIAKGIVENNDLVLQSPNIEASGKGTVSLPAWQINYRFEPKVGERRQGAAGQKFVGQSIPVLVQGPLDHPKVAPDQKALIDAGVNVLKGIKGVNKYLAPLGLDNASGATSSSTTGTTKQNPLNALKGLLGQ